MITTVGTPEADIVTGTDPEDLHPAALVTEKVKIPPGRFAIVLLIPVPEVITAPGILVIVQAPEDGKPLSITLPVGTANVGCVIVPITGAVGAAGTVGMMTFADGTDKHPSAEVTV